MAKKRIKPNYRRRILRIPDLDHCKLAVLNSLSSPASRRVYEYAIEQFTAWYCSEPRLAFNRIVVVRYRMYLESAATGAEIGNRLYQRIPKREIWHSIQHGDLGDPTDQIRQAAQAPEETLALLCNRIRQRRSESRSARVRTYGGPRRP